MADELAKSSPEAPKAGEFKLGWGNETTVQQKGRVTKLSNPTFGTTYLIDVTDRDDPTRADPSDVLSKGEKLGDVFREDLEDPEYNDKFSSNNGVVAVITDKLDQEGRKRVFVGVSTFNVDDPGRREITTHILHSVGFQSDSFYVPFSFDSEKVREYIMEEIKDAVKDSGDKNLFSDFPQPALTYAEGAKI